MFFEVKFSIYLNRRVFVMGSWLLCFSLCTVCFGLFALLLGVIGKLCFEIVDLPGHILYYFWIDYLQLSHNIQTQKFP